MALANYQYQSNSGVTYQVTIPVDFAEALDLTPAAGDEPYLDATISPRYSNYQSLIAVSRSAIVGTSAVFSALPTTLVIGGNTYILRSAIGESIPPYVGPLLLAPQGAQGSPGPQGPQGIPGGQNILIATSSQIAPSGTDIIQLDSSSSIDVVLTFDWIGHQVTVVNTGGPYPFVNSVSSPDPALHFYSNTTPPVNQGQTITVAEVPLILCVYSTIAVGGGWLIVNGP